jgi:hypothetical protein
MKRALFASVAIVALAIPAALACGDMPVCFVADPTGTALNVRLEPGADVITTLDNGVEVEVIDYQTFEDQEWVLIATSGPSWGYVVKDQLDCNESDDYSEICTIDAHKGLIEVFDNAEGGALNGTLDNGIRVRPYDTIEVGGVEWVAIDRYSDDNKLGWVFNSYLSCGEPDHAV